MMAEGRNAAQLGYDVMQTPGEDQLARRPDRSALIEEGQMAANKKHKPLPPLTPSDIARFWKFVDVRGPDECWPWKGGHQGPDGYGNFYFNGTMISASRVAFIMNRGHDAFPFYVLHNCDWKPCCNPAHLSPGTHKKNVIEAWDRIRPTAIPRREVAEARFAKPGYEDRRGERHAKAVVTEQQVRDIRARYPSENITYEELATEYGLSRYGVYAIIHRKSWKHLA